MDYLSNYETGDELQHYGVKGMKWGVRRASKQLSRATDSQSRDKAVASLNKHRAKSVQKIKELEGKRDKLNTALTKSSQKDAVKATKYEQKAAKYDKKASKATKKSYRAAKRARGAFFSDSTLKWATKSELYKEKAADKQVKADLYRAKAKSYAAKYEQAKAKVEANERMIATFQQGVRDIDSALVNKGRRYING